MDEVAPGRSRVGRAVEHHENERGVRVPVEIAVVEEQDQLVGRDQIVEERLDVEAERGRRHGELCERVVDLVGPVLHVVARDVAEVAATGAGRGHRQAVDASDELDRVVVRRDGPLDRRVEPGIDRARIQSGSVPRAPVHAAAVPREADARSERAVGAADARARGAVVARARLGRAHGARGPGVVSAAAPRDEERDRRERKQENRANHEASRKRAGAAASRSGDTPHHETLPERRGLASWPGSACGLLGATRRTRHDALMPGSSFGVAFRVTTAGESHGPANVVIVDGCPPGLELSLADLVPDLARRRPGQSRLVSQRDEGDAPEILSGVFEGKTTGTPIAILVRNEDARGRDYADLADKYRPRPRGLHLGCEVRVSRPPRRRPREREGDGRQGGGGRDREEAPRTRVRCVASSVGSRRSAMSSLASTTPPP